MQEDKEIEEQDWGDMCHSCFNCHITFPNYVRTVKAEQIWNLGFIYSFCWYSFVMNFGHKMKKEFQVVEEENKLVFIFRGDLWPLMEKLGEPLGHLVKLVLCF